MIQKFGAPVHNNDGHLWQYYVEEKFAFAPMYMQGTLIWLQRYWQTWPVDLTTGSVVKQYRVNFPYNPRARR